MCGVTLEARKRIGSLLGLQDQLDRASIMSIASHHPKQAERLQALYSYEILDTDREKAFDDVAKLAAEICGTAISVINLIDAERQWFKAEVGLGVRETPLETSICSHVILGQDFVEIEDTVLDARMQDNPLSCGDPGLRFYAGALLKSDDGLPIGTLCVLDWQPRQLSALQRDAIRVLAKQVMAQLDLRRSLRTAETLRKEVDHRVKNSLQTLSSFAGIQARSSKSVEAKQAFEHMHQRIQTVAMLHEQLYKTDAGSHVDLGRYVENVANFLRGVAPDNVVIETEIEHLLVGSEQASSVGLILNEFAANSFKHAFPDERKGVMRFALAKKPDGLIEIKCADDGVGMRINGHAAASGLGFKIKMAACQRLGCELTMEDAKPGVIARFEFEPGMAG